MIFMLSLVAAVEFAVADTTHVVQKGETLYSLSRTYGTTVQAICEANGIADGSSVQAGQKLTIPGDAAKTSADGAAVSKKDAGAETKTNAPAEKTKPAEAKSAAAKAESPKPAQTVKAADGTYTVQKGDTWYGIARTYSTNVNELYALNGADTTTTLKVGQKIKVPGANSSATNGTGKTAVATAKDSKDSAKNTAKANPITVSVPKIEDPRTYSGKKGDSSLVWPVQKPAVTYIEGKISGVNLSAQKDESVTAIRAGTVMFSGTYRGFGNVVFIQSKTGHIYAYTGLGTVKVNKGDYCVFGAQIGTAGVDSYTSKPQMSLMVFQNGLPIDPAKAPRG